MKEIGQVSRRCVIKGIVSLIVATQILLFFLFFTRRIREPYPAVILPSFDQVLFDEQGFCTFLIPRFYARLESGKKVEVSYSKLRLPGVSGAKFWWIVARLAAPEGTKEWKPSLPSYNYPFEEPTYSQYLLDLLGKSAARLRLVGKPKELLLVWERQRFDTHNVRVPKIDTTPVGSWTIEIPSYDKN